MPYFDDTTYAIGNCIGNDDLLYSFAEEFISHSAEIPSYPEQILEAERQAFLSENRNEIIIMADATSVFRLHMEKAFDAALTKAKSRESRFELICISLGAYSYSYKDNIGMASRQGAFFDKLVKTMEDYNEEFGSDDLSFVKGFLIKRIEEIKIEQQNAAAAYAERARIKREREMQEEVEEQRRKERRQAEKQRIIEEQNAIRKAKNELWRAKVGEFRKLPVSDQLQTILSDQKPPAVYGIDYEAISDSDLKAIPKSMLVQVITSFMNVKDAGWKELQKKARIILSE